MKKWLKQTIRLIIIFSFHEFRINLDIIRAPQMNENIIINLSSYLSN